jgi:hypothetical protein
MGINIQLDYSPWATSKSPGIILATYSSAKLEALCRVL